MQNPPAITPAILTAVCGQYDQTIVALNARLANLTANLVRFDEENRALRTKVEELERAPADPERAP